MKIPGMRSVPDVPTPGQSLGAFETFKLWFSMNRKPIGTVFTALSALALAASFENHATYAAILSALGTIVGGVTAGAGTFHNDQYHEDRAKAEVRTRSGQYPAYQRRHGDPTPGGEKGDRVGVRPGTRRLP